VKTWPHFEQRMELPAGTGRGSPKTVLQEGQTS